MAGVTDESTPEIGESRPTDWLDPEALLSGPFGGRPTRPRGRRLTRPELEKIAALTPQQRLAILDCWQRSGLPAKDFAPLVGVSRHTLYAWKQRFQRLGTAGFLDQPRRTRREAGFPMPLAGPFWCSRSRNPTGGASGSATCCSGARLCRRAP